LTEAGYPARTPWFYPSLGEYSELLERHGFEIAEARTFPRMTRLEHPERGMREWLEMFASSFFEPTRTGERDAIMRDIEGRLRPTLFHEGAWWVDYRRLRVLAFRRKLNAAERR
jgi:trans-aconitate 2-methyltransferase